MLSFACNFVMSYKWDRTFSVVALVGDLLDHVLHFTRGNRQYIATYQTLPLCEGAAARLPN